MKLTPKQIQEQLEVFHRQSPEIKELLQSYAFTQNLGSISLIMSAIFPEGKQRECLQLLAEFKHSIAIDDWSYFGELTNPSFNTKGRLDFDDSDFENKSYDKMLNDILAQIKLDDLIHESKPRKSEIYDAVKASTQNGALPKDRVREMIQEEVYTILYNLLSDLMDNLYAGKRNAEQS